MGEAKMSAAEDEAKTAGNIDGDRRSAGGERRFDDNRQPLESRDLFVGTRDIVIGHGAEAYHLRLTAQNKLILTK